MIEAALEAVARQADGLVAGELFQASSEPPVGELEVVVVPQEGLQRYKRMVAHSREHSLEQRRRNETAEDYFHNIQWSSAEIAVLRKRKQPEIWVNRIAPAVNGVLGVIEQGASDPRAFPRNRPDLNGAEIATDSLRFAADKAEWAANKLAAAKDYLIASPAAVLIGVDPQSLDVTTEHIPWDEFFADPHSRRNDFSDARYMGIAKWRYADEVAADYPQAMIDTAARGTAHSLGMGDDPEDKPTTAGGTHWGDGKTNRLLQVEMYHLEAGVWQRCVFYGGGVLEAGESPYADENGQPTNPIEAQSAFVNRERQRYGIVAAMIPLQDEVNMQRSKKLHLLNSRRVRQVSEDILVSIETVRAEAARPDGVIPYGFDVVENSSAAAAHSAVQSEATGELERMGPNPAVLGRDGASASGRSHLVRQQAGLTELTPALGGLERWEVRVYRQMWARIRQYWTEPKLVRVTDDQGAPKFIELNKAQVTGRQLVLDPASGMPTIQPVVQVENSPAEIDVDIIIDSTPDTVSVQQEQFAELVKLAGIYGPQEVPFDDLLEASSLPRKRELIDKRKERQEQAQQGQQGPDPLQQAALEAELEDKRAGTEQKRSVALLNLSKAAGYHDPNATPSQGAVNPMQAMAPQPIPQAQPGF